MKNALRCLLLTGICVAGLESATAAEPVRLEAGQNLRWFKGNMHTHSLWSDGDNYPEMIARWYRDRDYQFLVFTDHNTLLNRERWIDTEKNKGGLKAFETLQAADFPKDWVQTRMHEGRQQVRLKQFDEIFDQLAVPQQYLLIQGEEISDQFGRRPIHMCVTGNTTLLPPLGGDSVVEVMQRNTDAALSHRDRTGEATLIHLNHPNFYYAVTAEQLMQVVGENFFEVYNGHPAVENAGDATHASTEQMWDIINTWRLAKLDLPVMYGLATDDGHDYFREKPGQGSQPGRGWVMVLADTLAPDAVINALNAGQFYSSSGVTLSSVVSDDKQLAVTVDAQPGVTYTIDFIGTRSGFDDSTTPATEDEAQADLVTRRYSEDVGRVLKTVTGAQATYEFSGDELYVRARITSSQPHPNPAEKGDVEQAWTQPVRP